jgi:hypothetical protein
MVVLSVAALARGRFHPLFCLPGIDLGWKYIR